MFETFMKVHFALAFTAIGSLLWHLLPGDFVKVLFPATALLLWVLNVLFRLVCTGRTQQAVITRFHSAGDYSPVTAIELKLELNRPVTVKPGQYFYLRFPSGLRFRDKFQTHPYMVTWWEEPTMRASQESLGAIPSATSIVSKDERGCISPLTGVSAKYLTFLVQPQMGLSARLAMQSSVKNVIFDGPYGQDLRLHRYETVMLVAEGIGIAGVLSFALHLANWKFHGNPDYARGVITRKVDLYWVLEGNHQERWVAHQLKELIQKDTKLVSAS